jgi:hypothetical protein
MDVMPIFMLINDILCFCMLLAYHLCFISTMFMREEDQVKPWSRVQLLAIRRSLVTFILFYLLLNLKITKTLVTYFVLFWFCKLASCWCLTITTVSWGRKNFVYCCRLLEEWSPPQSSLRVRYEPRVTLVEKTSLTASICAWSPNKWHFKE